MFSFLKENFNRLPFRQILLEGVVVSVTEYLMLGAFVLVNFLINHYYGTEVVGIYALSYAIAQIGILGIGSVYSLLMRRDLSVGQYDSNSYVSRVQFLRSSNMAVVLILSALIIISFYPPLRPSLLFILLMIGAKGLDALSETYYTAYQTLNRLGDYSFFKGLHAIVFIAVSVFVCFRHFEIQYLYISQLACSVAILGVNVFRWQRSKGEQERETVVKTASYRFLLIESYPLMVSAMIFQLGLRANNILIFDKLGEKDLGMFSLVVITVGIFAGVANALAIVFFGRLSQIFVDQPKKFFKRLHQTIGLFLGIGIFFFLLYQGTTPLIAYFFKMEIDPRLNLVMSAAIPFMFIVSCLGAVFTIIRKQKVGMYLTVVVLIFNLSTYYLLSGKFALIGAGYAYLISAVFQSILIYAGMLISLTYANQIEGDKDDDGVAPTGSGI